MLSLHTDSSDNGQCYKCLAPSSAVFYKQTEMKGLSFMQYYQACFYLKEGAFKIFEIKIEWGKDNKKMTLIALKTVIPKYDIEKSLDQLLGFFMDTSTSYKDRRMREQYKFFRFGLLFNSEFRIIGT